MRKFINIVEKFETPADQFGSGSLSRTTDADETLAFSVFAVPADVEAVNAIIARFPNVQLLEVKEPTRVFVKYRFVCQGTRADAEAVARAVKMARLQNSVTQII